MRRVDGAHRAVAATLVLLGIVAGIAVVLTARSNADLEADAATRAAAADAVPVVALSLRSSLNEAAAQARSVTRPIPFDRAQAAGVPLDTAVRARDTGEALLDDTGVVVAATYERGRRPQSVAERRETVTGLYVAPLDLEATVTRTRPQEGGVVVTGPERDVAGVPGSAPPGAASYAVELSPLLAPDWTVTVWTQRPGVPAPAWTVAAALFLAGIAAGGLALIRSKAGARTAEELRRLRQQNATTAGLASVAQRSLDLADVLPAFSTQLRDALGLRGLRLSTPTERGERPFFESGEAPAPPAPTSGLPAAVAAGESVSLLLTRGGRTVARLSVLAGRDLGRHEVATLGAVAETLTSALANAEAFARQREALQRMRSVDELKTVFLATASHELRTPVGVMSGFAQLLSKRSAQLSPEEIRTYAERLDANAQQLSALVENLLDFSRLERGVGPNSEQTLLDLGVAVELILDQHPDLAAEHTVTPQLTPGLRVLGSAHAVERVLTNLVGNASKYSPAGTTIWVRVVGQEGRAVLLVDDEGPGVPVEDRPHVFSRFFRGAGDAVVNTRGAGLGLAIVGEFAASMGGEVSVATSPSGGARFAVSYPLASPPPAGPPAAGPPAAGPPLAGPREGESDEAS